MTQNSYSTLGWDSLHQFTLDAKDITDRAPHLNEEGGALNADYTVVEAVAVICAKAGNLGLKYGEDFYWQSSGNGTVSFSFRDLKNVMILGLSV